uniref:Uncharacterized protein n=1 Tax=Ananas comosus var. bracteatus TaxID=296719 RepID=A0A6V7QWI0_ANACO
MKMPETARYTALIAGNAKQAAMDMGKVMELEIDADADKLAQFKAANDYPLLSREFLHRHASTSSAPRPHGFCSTSPSTARISPRRTSSPPFTSSNRPTR